jgi:hypothetical protein
VHRLSFVRQRLAHRELGTGALKRRIGAVGQQSKRRHDRGLTRNARGKFGRVADRARPIADGQRTIGRAREGMRIVRIALQHLLVACDRLLVAAQPIKRGAAAVERLGRSRVERERAFKTRQRFVEAPKLEQVQPAIAPGFPMVGVDRERAVAGRKRLVVGGAACAASRRGC